MDNLDRTLAVAADALQNLKCASIDRVPLNGHTTDTAESTPKKEQAIHLTFKK